MVVEDRLRDQEVLHLLLQSLVNKVLGGRPQSPPADHRRPPPRRPGTSFYDPGTAMGTPTPSLSVLM